MRVAVTVKLREQIHIGPDVVVTVLRFDRGEVRLLIDRPACQSVDHGCMLEERPPPVFMPIPERVDKRNPDRP